MGLSLVVIQSVATVFASCLFLYLLLVLQTNQKRMKTKNKISVILDCITVLPHQVVNRIPEKEGYIFILSKKLDK